jgi:alpha-1,2-mannosyltransferase
LSPPSSRLRRAWTAIDWLLALSITTVALAFFLNGSFFSTLSALHVDLSINWTAAHALLDGEVPYGETTLRERAAALDGPTFLLYHQLFTSYIQPPTSALSLTPLTLLDWREATRFYLVMNHMTLALGLALSLYNVRPTLPWRWVIAIVSLVLVTYGLFYMSFALGQVDATLLLLFAIGFWGYQRGHAAVAGIAIAIGAAIKLIPGVLILYFLWKRDYRAAAWGIGAGLLFLVVSLPAAGLDTYETYLTETFPALSKGSSQYSNISLNGAIAREFAPPVVDGQAKIQSLDELPSDPTARPLMMATGVALLGLLALVIRRQVGAPAGDDGTKPAANVFEYYLVVAIALLASSVTWDFYTIWLIPALLAAFVAPSRVLPRPAWLRAAVIVAFAAAIVGLNLPGDFYLFEPNGVFYHPDWVPGLWLEERIWLYHGRLDLVPYIRLASLGLLTCTLIGLVLWRRLNVERTAESAVPVPAEGQMLPGAATRA